MSAVSLELAASAQSVVFREALYLDTQRWDEWLGLYA
jgi:3-phenylpropionate/cinnamic acid dioxygenase small subunit